MDVWVALEYDWDDCSVRGVFDSEDQAIEFARAKDCEIEKHTLNKPDEGKQSVQVWEPNPAFLQPTSMTFRVASAGGISLSECLKPQSST